MLQVLAEPLLPSPLHAIEVLLDHSIHVNTQLIEHALQRRLPGVNALVLSIRG
jgi:hypothetical protein